MTTGMKASLSLGSVTLFAGIAERYRCLDYCVDISLACAVINDRRTDREMVTDHCSRWCNNPRLVKIGDDCCIQLIGIVATVAETRNVESHRCKKFKFRRRNYPSFE